MTERLVWFVLEDGSSIVAGCGDATRERVAALLRAPQSLVTLRCRGRIEQLAASRIREFLVFDARTPALQATARSRSLQL